jgi:hypothetical protein
MVLYSEKQSLHNIYVKFNNKLFRAVITFTNENVNTMPSSGC